MKEIKIKLFDFTPIEETAIRERILGKITEIECAKRLKISRQRVDSAIAHYTMTKAREGSSNVC